MTTQNSTPLIIISSSPHMHNSNSIDVAMRDVLLSLLPAVLAAIYYFRTPALLLILTCVATAMLAEGCCQKLMRRPITVCDGSAALTGLLLALCLPPTLPLTLGFFGSACAIIIGKQCFGGLGCNLFNPAHLGRAILLASFPQQMTTWVQPATATLAAVTSATGKAGVAAVTTATPLALLRQSEFQWLHQNFSLAGLPALSDLFWGNTAGSLGETCIPALVLGGIFLLWRGHIDWRVPAFYLGTVVVLTGCYGYFRNYPDFFALYHLCSGGLIIGAFFMATDWVTSPISRKGRIIYALGLGILTSLIRLRGSYIEGVCYSILIMNMLTPLIDSFTRTTPFGGGAMGRE